MKTSPSGRACGVIVRDLFDGAADPPPFKDIRNTRPGVSTEKAELALALGRLCLKPPPKVMAGSVDLVRRWRAAQEKGMKVLNSKRATVPDLTAAITNMRSFL